MARRHRRRRTSRHKEGCSRSAHCCAQPGDPNRIRSREARATIANQRCPTLSRTGERSQRRMLLPA
jgi:hypothetical protein